MPVRGMVVKILSAQAIVINVGNAAGVNCGAIVHIVHTGEEIKDPAGGASLGRLEYIKAILRVSHAQERMATCTPATAPVSAAAGEESSLYRTVSSDMARVTMERSVYGTGTTAMEVKSADISGMPTIPPVAVGDAVVVM